MLSSNRHVTLRLTIFEKFAVKWHKFLSERPEMVHLSPFLDPAFGDPKDIAIKRGEARSHIVQTSRRSPAPSPRYVSPNTKIERITADLISDKTHTSVAFVG